MAIPRILPTLLLTLLLGGGTAARCKTLKVGQGARYEQIGAALAQAQAGDTVWVGSGTYHEWNLQIKTPRLTLLGNGRPVLDAQGTAATILHVRADSVRIEGFRLGNTGVSHLEELAGIKLTAVRGCQVINNQLFDCFFGIYFENCTHSCVARNHVKAHAQNEISSGNAIHLWKCEHMEVANNHLENHRDGIYFEFVNNSQIHGNTSEQNLRYGLHFMFSHHDRYTGNTFRGNGAGVAVMFSDNIRMENNRFLNNWGGSSYGLLLKEMEAARIVSNHFDHNTTGILMEGCTRVSITRNTLLNNGKALDIKGNSIDCKILRNDFLANTFEVVTNTQHNQNRYEWNYWSQYKGYDLNRDGYGDTPHRPVTLFSKITAEIPAAMLMNHSIFVGLLTLGERILPQLTPANLSDPSPRMHSYGYD